MAKEHPAPKGFNENGRGSKDFEEESKELSEELSEDMEQCTQYFHSPISRRRTLGSNSPSYILPRPD